MHHHVHALSKLNGGRARCRVTKNGQFFARLRCGEIILAVDDAPVLQRNVLSVLQALEQRSRLYAIGDERGGIQRAGFVVFLNAVAIALHRMIKRSAVT